VKKLLLVLAVLLVIPFVSGCGLCFNGATPADDRGDLDYLALVLDICPGFLLGLLPILLDAIAGGLWKSRKDSARRK
jgi:hypothetical protein